MEKGSLKIKKEVYNRFLDAREGRETQTDTLKRLLDIHDAGFAIAHLFELSPEYLEWKRIHATPRQPFQPGTYTPAAPAADE